MKLGSRLARRGSCGGFTMVVALLAMTTLALASSAVMIYTSKEMQREREDQLIRIGAEYASAIQQYYDSSPGTTKRLPTRLDDLVDDPRFVSTKRHLRRLHRDPVTGGPFGLMYGADGGIEGVHSTSKLRPLRTSDLPGVIDARGDGSYADWKFIGRHSGQSPRT